MFDFIKFSAMVYKSICVLLFIFFCIVSVIFYTSCSRKEHFKDTYSYEEEEQSFNYHVNPVVVPTTIDEDDIKLITESTSAEQNTSTFETSGLTRSVHDKIICQSLQCVHTDNKPYTPTYDENTERCVMKNHAIIIETDVESYSYSNIDGNGMCLPPPLTWPNCQKSSIIKSETVGFNCPAYLIDNDTIHNSKSHNILKQAKYNISVTDNGSCYKPHENDTEIISDIPGNIYCDQTCKYSEWTPICSLEDKCKENKINQTRIAMHSNISNNIQYSCTDISQNTQCEWNDDYCILPQYVLSDSNCTYEINSTYSKQTATRIDEYILQDDLDLLTENDNPNLLFYMFNKYELPQYSNNTTVQTDYDETFCPIRRNPTECAYPDVYCPENGEYTEYTCDSNVDYHQLTINPLVGYKYNTDGVTTSICPVMYSNCSCTRSCDYGEWEEERGALSACGDITKVTTKGTTKTLYEYPTNDKDELD